MPYSETVMQHFYRPQNQYVMEAPDAVGIAGRPGRGNFMTLYVRLQDQRIVEASFQCHGCAPAIAAGSLLSGALAGAQVAETNRWSEEAINDALGGLPPHKRYCSALAAAALHDIIQQTRARVSEEVT